MPKVSRKELARITGVKYDAKSRSRISKAVARGVLLEDENGLIDIDLQPNKEWVVDQKLKNSKDESEDDLLSDEISVVAATSAGSIELKLKKQELLKKEAETKLLNLREQKMRGELMPVDIAVDIFKRFSQDIMHSSKNVMEDALIFLAKKKDLTNAEVAEIRIYMIDALNSAMDKAVKSTTDYFMDQESADDEKDEDE